MHHIFLQHTAHRPGDGYDIVILPFLLLAEFAWLKFSGRDGYDLKESATSLAVAAGQIALRGVSFLLLLPVFTFVYDHRLFDIELRGAAIWIGFFLLFEFSYYWFHRFSHTVRWLWATHRVHHSSSRYNLSCAYRLGWTNVLSGGWLFLVPMMWLGFPSAAVAGMFAANLAYQFFLHTEVIGRLGPLEWVLNTPSSHRVHHAKNAGYLDRNFGGVLIVYDRLFGTYAREPATEPLSYGLAGHETRYNPVAVAFGEWVAMGRDLVKARGPGEMLKVAFGKP